MLWVISVFFCNLWAQQRQLKWSCLDSRCGFIYLWITIFWEKKNFAKLKSLKVMCFWNWSILCIFWNPISLHTFTRWLQNLTPPSARTFRKTFPTIIGMEDQCWNYRQTLQKKKKDKIWEKNKNLKQSTIFLLLKLKDCSETGPSSLI